MRKDGVQPTASGSTTFWPSPSSSGNHRYPSRADL
jgi:hypothetical protein